MQERRLLGISPVNLFSDMSNFTKWTRLPTSNGNDPIKKFQAKLSEIEKVEIAKSCFVMRPLRLL